MHVIYLKRFSISGIFYFYLFIGEIQFPVLGCVARDKWYIWHLNNFLVYSWINGVATVLSYYKATIFHASYNVFTVN